MDDFRDLMYDLIIESLIDKLENYEITMEDAEIFSEAAYDELFYEESLGREMGRSFATGAAAAAGSLAAYHGIKAIKNHINNRKNREAEDDNYRASSDDELKQAIGSQNEYKRDITHRLDTAKHRSTRRDLNREMRENDRSRKMILDEMKRRGIE